MCGDGDDIGQVFSSVATGVRPARNIQHVSSKKIIDTVSTFHLKLSTRCRAWPQTRKTPLIHEKKSTSKSAFFNIRILVASVFCIAGVALALFSNAFAQTKGAGTNQSGNKQDAPGTQTPDVVRMVGPVRLDNVNSLPYIAPESEFETQLLMRYPHGNGQPGAQPGNGVSGLAYVQQLLKNLWRPTPTMPAPILTFEGGAAAQFCACAPPD
jgi:hypothetical protein